MPQQILTPSDRDLLRFICSQHAKDGPIERNILSVRARGNGLEVARALLNLKAQGLVEETIRRPGVLRRLFGARTRVSIRPTEAGIGWQEAPAEAAPASDLPAAEAAVQADTAPRRDEGAEAAPVTIPVAIPVAPPLATPPRPAEKAEQAAAEAEDHQAPPAPRDVTPAAPAAPVVPAVATPASSPAPAPNPAATAAATAASAAPRPPRPAPRPRLDAFTEDLGGPPIEEAVTFGGAPVAAEVLDGLRETLALQGMELTAAGETLVADRMAQGASQGDALCQVVLFTYAHAVHFATLDGSLYRPGALRAHALDTMRALEGLRDGGAIGEARFEADMRALWTLVGEAPEAPQLAAQILSDPIGGMAPPAVLPEDQLLAEDDDEDAPF